MIVAFLFARNKTEWVIEDFFIEVSQRRVKHDPVTFFKVVASENQVLSY